MTRKHIEHFYLGAPFERPEQQAFNEHLRELLSHYAMRLSLPESPPEAWMAAHYAPIAKSKVAVAVVEPGGPEPWVQKFIDTVNQRHVPLVGILHGAPADVSRYKNLFDRVVYVPQDRNHFTGPLINTLNLYL